VPSFDLGHKTTGPIVRIAPNHISIADLRALNASMPRHRYLEIQLLRRLCLYKTRCVQLFNTRDRAEHTRKRKIVSHVFSQKNVLEFEPNLKRHVTQLIEQWDRKLYDLARKDMSGEGGREGKNGRLYLDILPCELWFHNV